MCMMPPRGIRRINGRLLLDTLARALDASRRVDSFAIITDAKDEDARSFYQRYGFQLLPTESHDRHLFLSIGTVER
jgi:ribosomal protein S18 acetylase RimI-like enzyme